MARRLRPLTAGHLDTLPGECAGCVFWESAGELDKRCGAACDMPKLREWYAWVAAEWGECGRVACEGDEVLGFIKYAPPAHLPQSRHFPAGAPGDGCVMLACLHTRPETRRLGLGSLLLHAALRDLASRGERRVVAYACPSRPDMSAVPVIGIEFLLRNGFRVARPDPVYPLLEMDLRSLATWAESIEAALQALRLPLRSAQRAPTPSPSIR